MKTASANQAINGFGRQIAGIRALDAPAKRIGRTVRERVGAGTVKDVLSGTWLGHSLHPVLTDVVIGSWTSATLLDLFGGRDSDGGAERLIAVGIAASVPTMVTGLTDWADSEVADDSVRRIGVVHATANSLVLALYVNSLIARRSGRRGRGALLAAAGAGALTAGGWLGGHLAYAHGIGVDQNVFDAGPEEWARALPSEDLPSDKPKAADVDTISVLLLRRGPRIFAIHDRCSHRGCSLASGHIDNGVVTCRCHGSRFALEDGKIMRGPATVAQPLFDVREREGWIEVRRAN